MVDEVGEDDRHDQRDQGTRDESARNEAGGGVATVARVGLALKGCVVKYHTMGAAALGSGRLTASEQHDGGHSEQCGEHSPPDGAGRGFG